MEETNYSNQPQQSMNQSSPYGPYGQFILPNSTASLVLGIISTAFGLFWCYWFGSFISLVCGIIGLILSRSAANLHSNNPGNYTQSSVNNNNAGKVLSIIGLCLSGLALIGLIIVVIFFGAVIGLAEKAAIH